PIVLQHKRKYRTKRTWPSWSPVRRQPDTGFDFARIYFPRDFKHLTNQERQWRKRATPARYPVTLGYNNDYEDNPLARAAIDNFANTYRNYQTVMVPNVTVSS
ncbi:MAG: hypothetical protein ACKPKO_41070, partial [Candidatus Fonsibacter sp.]